MSKQFNSYSELLAEKQRLEGLLQVQKAIIRQDVQDIKAQLQPVKDVVGFMGKILTRDKSSLALTIGSDVLISTVMNKILSKSAWLSRLILPFFIKNYSSHFIAEKKDKWIKMLAKWLGKSKNGKHKHAENVQENEDDVF